ncbi:MAG: CCA tRNA nucleotidyltransferase [Candidatus Omnitrophica bacterium]|nr:CCA tRNA nucleotidyltransferase [Candidatus Omnitrophota bacterium]
MTRMATQVPIPRRVEPLLRAIGGLADQRGMRAYAVGGCVRDWLLGLPIDTPDLDVTVEGDGIAVARAAGHALGGTLTVHQQFGTATQRLRRRADGGRPSGPLRVDFATCRRETYARPAAYPKIAAGTLKDDLFRRDFTVNAMAAALSPARFGALVDPFHGARDLEQRRLRVLHGRSFLDDPSRLLRGIRFAQRFGLRWEPLTRRAAEEAVAAGALGWLNAGRLRRELARMRGEPDPLACFEALAALLNSSVGAA